MTKEELEIYADQYCIGKFGAKTGNKSVRDALIDGYNLALRIHAVVGRSEQLKALDYLAEKGITGQQAKTIAEWMEDFKSL